MHQAAQIESAFIHIPKTGGTFVNHFLRSLYGLQHVDLLANRNGKNAMPSWRSAVRVGELSIACQLNQAPRSVASHFLVPTDELRECMPNAKWFAVVRDPIERLVSEYRHKCQLLRRVVPLEEWSDDLANPQTRMLVKSGRAVDCIQAVANGDVIVIDLADLKERLAEAFNLSRNSRDWLHRQRPLNVKFDNCLADEPIYEELSKHRLRDYVTEELYFFEWIKRRSRNGANAQIARISQGTRWATSPVVLHVNRYINRLYRNIIYKPAFRIVGLNVDFNRGKGGEALEASLEVKSPAR